MGPCRFKSPAEASRDARGRAGVGGTFFSLPALQIWEQPEGESQTQGELGAWQTRGRAGGSHTRDKGTEMSSNSSELEWALHVLVKNYDKYASGCCRKPRRITKKDFRKMLSRELNHMLTDTGNRRAADKLICDLDENKDGHISFEEYWTLIGGIASPIACLIRQQEHGIGSGSGTKFTK